MKKINGKHLIHYLSTFVFKSKIILLELFILLIIACLIAIAFSNSNNMKKNSENEFQKIRQPAVAGQFYPADKQELKAMIDEFLGAATSSNATGTAQVIIVPHAGYVYSGQVAAFGFKQLQESGFKRAIIIGRSHQQYFNGVIADANEAWQTPLGKVMVDKDLIRRLASSTSIIKIDSDPHKSEHSLEVEVPFLQETMGNDFKIVPLLFGGDEPSDVQKLSEALAKIIDDKIVVIVSSDLSHYPEYETANELDRKTIETILSTDTLKLRQDNIEAENGALGQGVATLSCGEPAIATAMFLAKELGLEGKLLEYANSGDYFKETKNRVVGYAAIGFYRTYKSYTATLSAAEQGIALQIARKTLEAAFDDFDNEEYKLPADLPEIFQEKRGVFVTLKEQGELRGCIGNFSTNFNLAQNIQEMALSAAFDDPRFPPLEEQELKDIGIEISVLSPMQKITDPNIIEVGKHGVYVKKGTRSGVYLPQVATEMGWTREQFLDSLCEQKSGLGKSCWKDPSVDIYIFTAQVFNEN